LLGGLTHSSRGPWGHDVEDENLGSPGSAADLAGFTDRAANNSDLLEP
jgi:hypothetical protein